MHMLICLCFLMSLNDDIMLFQSRSNDNEHGPMIIGDSVPIAMVS